MRSASEAARLDLSLGEAIDEEATALRLTLVDDEARRGAWARGSGSAPGSGDGVGSWRADGSTVGSLTVRPGSSAAATGCQAWRPWMSSTAKRLPRRSPKPVRTSSSNSISADRSMPSSQSSMPPSRVPPGVLGGKDRLSV